MNPLHIFISSVQGELAEERAALRDYVRGDPLIRRFFEVFLFEDAPASDRRPDQLYLDEVDRCDVYVGLFGLDYGNEDEEGVSPTEREFDRATAVGVHRLIFVKGSDDARHPKMQALIRKAQGRSDPETLPHGGGARGRPLCGVGRVSGRTGAHSLGAFRCCPMRQGDAG